MLHSFWSDITTWEFIHCVRSKIYRTGSCGHYQLQRKEWKQQTYLTLSLNIVSSSIYFQFRDFMKQIAFLCTYKHKWIFLAIPLSKSKFLNTYYVRYSRVQWVLVCWKSWEKTLSSRELQTLLIQDESKDYWSTKSLIIKKTKSWQVFFRSKSFP